MDSEIIEWYLNSSNIFLHVSTFMKHIYLSDIYLSANVLENDKQPQKILGGGESRNRHLVSMRVRVP